MLATAMCGTAVLAEPAGVDFGKVIADRLMEYAGLNEETQTVDMAGEAAKEPRVMAFGYENSSMTDNGLLGFDLGLNMDLGWNYELPLYNQDQFLVARQRASLFAGGRQWFSVTLYAVRFYLFLDLYLGKATADNYVRYDVVNYGDFCAAGQWLVDMVRASLLFQIDVNECVWGLVGSLTNNTQDCDWGTYYINQPFLDYQPVSETMEGDLYPSTCGESIPTYDG